MIKKLSLLAFCILFLSSCYTIHFKRTSRSVKDYQVKKWHHIGLGGLMEFSPPVDLKSICPKDSWQAVRSQTGFLQGLVRLISISAGVGFSNFVSAGSETSFETSLRDLSNSAVEISSSSAVGASSFSAVSASISLGQLYSPEEVAISCRAN